MTDGPISFKEYLSQVNARLRAAESVMEERDPIPVMVSAPHGPPHAPSRLYHKQDRVREKLASLLEQLYGSLGDLALFPQFKYHSRLNRRWHSSHLAERFVAYGIVQPVNEILNTIREDVNSGPCSQLNLDMPIIEVFKDKGSFWDHTQDRASKINTGCTIVSDRILSDVETHCSEILSRPDSQILEALPPPSSNTLPDYVRAHSIELSQRALVDMDQACIASIRTTLPDIQLKVVDYWRESSPAYLSVETKPRSVFCVKAVKTALDINEPAYHGRFKTFIRDHRFLPMRAAFLYDAHQDTDDSCMDAETRDINESIAQEWKHMVRSGQTWGIVTGIKMSVILEIDWEADRRGNILNFAFCERDEFTLLVAGKPNKPTLFVVILLLAFANLTEDARPSSLYEELSAAMQEEYQRSCTREELLERAAADSSADLALDHVGASYTVQSSAPTSITSGDTAPPSQLDWLRRQAPPGFFFPLTPDGRVLAACLALMLVRDRPEYFQCVHFLLVEVVRPRLWLSISTNDRDHREDLLSLRSTKTRRLQSPDDD